MSPRMTIEIRDLDSLATVDDVMDALKHEIPGTNDLKVYVFDPNVREQRMAVAEIDETAASALLQNGRIKIGWVYCRVRPRVIMPRCYRCQGYGHLKRDCKDPDRSEAYWSCGKAGHKSENCSGRPSCFLCREAGRPAQELVHVPGLGACSVFRTALRRQKGLEK